MIKLKVNEIFYSLQGEGANFGKPFFFVRLSECNLTCNFCDTEFMGYNEYSLEEIVSIIKQLNNNCKNILWTGGEPSLQLNEEIIDFFKSKNFYNAIETNGTNKLPKNLDWISISPKVSEHVLKKNFQNIKVNEIRYPIHKNKSLPKPSIEADFYFLSPIFQGDKIDLENLNYCIMLCKEFPKWRLSIQMHKILKIM